jgi:hypothetical protein
MRYTFRQAYLLAGIILAGFLLFGMNGYVWGSLFADRSEIALTRKLKELWWALHLWREGGFSVLLPAAGGGDQPS